MSGFCSGVLNADGSPASHCMRNDGELIVKRTKTLETIMEEHQVPSVIDYLSLDVEGLELEILDSFPFDKYTILCMSVEHNAETRNLIRIVMERNGYVFISTNNNASPHDDFYVHNSINPNHFYSEFAYRIGEYKISSSPKLNILIDTLYE